MRADSLEVGRREFRSPVVGAIVPLFILLTVATGAPNAFAQSESPTTVSEAEAGDKVGASETVSAKRSATIRFGIESEVLELIKALGSEKERRFDAGLLGLLDASRSPKLRTAILDFFKTGNVEEAESFALGIIEKRDQEEAGLVFSALAYLAEIKSKKALAFAPKLMEEDDKRLLPAVLRLLGRSGGPEEEELLLTRLEGETASEAIRLEAMRALGEIGSAKAVARLSKTAESPESAKMERIYACEALGKIKDPTAVTSLVKASNGDDPNVRAAAIEALGSFSGAEAENALIEALRDPFPKSRIAAAKAVAVRGLSRAVPNLAYKAQSDPEKAVRNEAARSLAALGGEEAWSLLKKLVGDRKREIAYRALAFGLLARKDPKGSMPFLVERLKAEAAEKDRAFYTALSRELSAADDAIEAAPLARVLLADKDYLFRIGGLEWARKTKSADIRPDLEAIAQNDPSDIVRKRALEILAASK